MAATKLILLFKFDGKKIKSIIYNKSELMGKNCNVFTEDLSIIAKSLKEEDIDIAISQMKPSYYYNQKCYTGQNHLC